MLQYFSLVMLSKFSTYSIVSYMVKAPNTTDPVIHHTIIKDNERCWQNSAQAWAQVRNLENNIKTLEENSRLNIT
jgi:hypothetical protein